MDAIDPALVANTLLAAPGWARVGLTAPQAELRQQAAHELARAILEQVSPATDAVDPNQLGLSF